MSTANAATTRWHARRLEHVRVADAMHARGDLLDRAVHLLSEHQAERLVVVGAATGRPVGVLSTLDVAGLLAWHENG